MRTTTISLTTMCDWDCSYCNVQDFGNFTTDVDKINKHVPYINELIGDHQFVVSGGEIGVLPEITLLHFFRSLDKKVIVNTNGLFMKRGFHKIPEIRKYIDKIYYHVVDHPKFKKVEVYDDPELEVLYGVVGNDISGIREFLTANHNIEVSYIGLDSDFDDKEMDYVSLLFMARQYPNVTMEALCQLENYALKYNHIQRYRKYCKSTSFSIDISAEKICLCAFRNKHIEIPLNRENLKRVISETNVLLGKDNCDTCTRVCLDIDLEGNIRDILNRR